jgi:hypothetical protein
VTVFDYAPDLEGYSESRRWPVEIATFHNGKERRNLLSSGGVPQRSGSFGLSSATSTAEDNRRVESMIRAAQLASVFDVPLWWSATELTAATSIGAVSFPCVTGESEFSAGGRVLVFAANGLSDVLIVQSFSSSAVVTTGGALRDYPAGALVVPIMRSVTDARANFSWVLQSYYSARVQAAESPQPIGVPTGGTAPSFPTVESLPVMQFRRYDMGNQSIESPAIIVGHDWQPWKKYNPEQDRADIAMRLIQHTREERSQLRAFFDGRQGPLLPFWVATEWSEVPVVAVTGADTFTVPRTAWAEDVLSQSGRTRWIWFPAQAEGFRVVSALGSSEIVTITVDGTLPSIAAGDAVDMLLYSRFASDTLTITSAPDLAPEASRAVVETREIWREAPDGN